MEVRQLITDGLAELQTGPFGTMLHASSYTPLGTPVVAVKNIGDNRILEEDVPRVNETDAERLTRYRLRAGDILFGRKGQVERRALVRDEEEGWLEGSDCIRLRFLDDHIDPVFVSYVLGTRAYRDWIVRNAQGATMPSLNQEIIGRILLPLPPHDEQRAIGHLLSEFDDKIQVNYRINDVLEEISRSLFKSWFIDFEFPNEEGKPYRSSGGELVYDDRLQRRIPSGWEVSEIGKEIEVGGGTTPDTTDSRFWEGGHINWATPKDLASLAAPVLIHTGRRITSQGLAAIGSRQYPSGSLLMSSRAPIGYLAITVIDTAVNQGMMAMNCRGYLSSYFMINWCRFNMEKIESMANGTTFKEISKSTFRRIPIAIPSKSTLSLFDGVAESIYSKIALNVKEAESLAAIRGALLPELISGRIRVSLEAS